MKQERLMKSGKRVLLVLSAALALLLLTAFVSAVVELHTTYSEPNAAQTEEPVDLKRV